MRASCVALCEVGTEPYASGVQVKFNKGDDLNLIVFEFYEERVPDTYPGQNFVSSDGLIRRRCVLPFSALHARSS